ncbi:hypothetical protein Tco_0626915 [Tanacetum coccineum]|uniref:Integrase, catalytic region, zinc finger, CCHC-type, peptidase aspartic, catalytic n=1 Tax=Tanacetum coccineum TaxID=301880 RepID=A0ABQ4WL30_9ASTR
MLVSYHKLYDILKQHQNEVNEIRAERLTRTANPLELVAQQQPIYHPQNHPNHYTQNSSTRSHPTATGNRGKAIANSPPPTYDQEPTMVAEDDELSKRAVNVAEARENVARECQKPKREKDAAYHKEKMLLCKQEEARFQLNAEQADWRDDTDDKPKDQELEAHYLYMTQIQEVTLDAADNSGPIFDTEPLQKVQNDNDNYNVFANDKEHPKQPESINDTYLEEQDDTDITIDSLDMSTNGETVDQDDDDLAKERDLLASLIEKLKYLKKFQAKLNRYHDVNYASKVAINCAKAKEDLMSYKMESEKSFNEYTQKINDLNQTISEMKKELVAHQEIISIMSQEKEAHKRFQKTREDKELEKVIALENKIKIMDDIVYKTGQSIQTMNMLNRNYKTSFVRPEYLKKAQRANPRMYDIGCYNDNLALMTKMPMVVPIIIREPKRTVNESIATPLKRIVASESSNQKPRSTIRKQYEQISTVKFGNDQIAPILGYGDLVQGNVTIKRVYYVEGLNHNLFFVGQFYDADLEVAF